MYLAKRLYCLSDIDVRGLTFLIPRTRSDSIPEGYEKIIRKLGGVRKYFPKIGRGTKWFYQINFIKLLFFDIHSYNTGSFVILVGI